MKKQLQKAGFTLIELIVVIAILGVLAGGAAVGYSGYVKKANKAADQQLVGSIERALDVGSYAFDLTPAVQLAGDGLRVPVGFVVLKKDGTANYATTSTTTPTNDAPCEMVSYEELMEGVTVTYGDLPVKYVVNSLDSIDGLIYKSDDYGKSIVNKDSLTTYQWPEGKVCKTHSTISTGSFTENGYAVAVDSFAYNAANTSEKINWIYNEGLDEEWNPVGGEGVLLLSASTIYTSESTPAHADGKSFSVSEVKTDDTGEAVAQSKALTDALTAAFGENWGSVKLSYDGWNAEGLGAEMPSLYAGGGDVFAALREIAEDNRVNFEGTAPEFNTAMKTIVGTITDKDTFSVYWNKISEADKWDNKDGGSYGDYFKKTTEEESTAEKTARRAVTAATALMYNAGFTTWMQQQTAVHNDIANVGATAETHAKAILGWGDKVHNPGDAANDPYTLCLAAFDSTKDSGLQVKECTACKELYEKYVSSGACAANASAAYDTFKTIADTGDTVLMHAEAVNKDKDQWQADRFSFFSYYESYMTEFKNMYGKMQREATDGSCIIIAVYRTGSGAMDYDVYPAAADPRKS